MVQRLSSDGAVFEFEWGTLFYVRKLLVLWKKMPVISLKNNGSFFKRKAFFED
jgi:hypothetical protein